MSRHPFSHLEEVRTASRRLAERMSLAYYLRHKRNADIVPALLSRYSALPTLATVNLIRERLEAVTSPEERGDLHRLLSAVVLFRDDVRLGAVEHAIRSAEDRAAAEVVPGVSSLDAIRQRLVVETDREARTALESARAAVAQRVTPNYAERELLLQEIAGEGGWQEYASYQQRWLSIDLDRTACLVNSVLEDTSAVYRAHLRRYGPLCGVSDDDSFSVHDVVHLASRDPFPDHCRNGGLLGGVRKTLGAAGIDIDAGGRVFYEINDKEGSAERAFTYPLNMPKKVIVCCPASRGTFAYYNLLHELGHALHFSHVDETLPFERKLLGDDSLTEGYAMLFGHLISNASWIAATSDEAISGEFVRFNYFRELVLFRRYGLKLLANIRMLRAGETGDMAAWYSNMAADILGAEVSPSTVYLEYDHRFYCARYLRAWMVEATLDAAVQAAHGEQWYSRREMMGQFKRAWFTGQSHSPDDILRSFFKRDLGANDLARRFNQHLQ